MTLNPITALRDSFEKLIIEHGSAVIQEKHIALFKDQLLIAEKENAKLTTENTVLNEKLKVLESENQNLKNENEQLKKKVQSYEQPNHDNLLAETKINILKLLFKQDKLPTEQIAQNLGYEIQTAKFHLEELKSHQMIKDIPYRKNKQLTIGWFLQQEGRRYLIENKLTS